MTKNRALTFKYAFEGLWIAVKDQPNLKFHLLSGVLVICLSWVFNITKIEWLVIIITIGGVISLELTNTAIEEVVDSFTTEIHPAAKKAKDVAAGAVLVGAITSVIIGLLIFLPYFQRLISY